MADLTQQQRDALPSSMFALPKERRFPLSSRSHVILAWDMVRRAKGLNDAKRAEARRNILRRARALGIDTSKWKDISLHASLLDDASDDAPATELSAARSSAFLADDDGHPNKMPFFGILTWLDVPSDNPPHGSNGMNVLIPSEIGVPALDSLIGMGVNFVCDGDWSSHSPTDKVGVITAAYPGEPDDDGGVPAYIEGFIYAQDFDDAASAIKTNQHLLGFSYETAKTGVVDDEYDGSPVKRVVDMGYFTGACILLKSMAAYTTTSIAASASSAEASSVNEKGDNDLANEMKPEHVAAMQALKGAIKHIDSITDSIMQEYGIPDPDEGNVQASSDPDDTNGKVDPDDAQDGMQASLSPNGDDPTSGKEIPALQASGNEGTSVQASEATLAASADVTASLDVLARLEALQAEVDALREAKAHAETQLQAAADAKTAQRTSIAYPTLVSKMDLAPQDEYTTLMASVDADESLSVEERMAKKFEIRDRIRKTASQAK